MKRSQATAVLSILLVFVAGATIGALGHRLYTVSNVTAKESDDWRLQYVSEMKKRVRLSTDQLDQLDLILDDTRLKFRAFKESQRLKPEFMKIKDEQISRVKAILTSGQIPEYEKLLVEREQRQHEKEAQELKTLQEELARKQQEREKRHPGK